MTRALPRFPGRRTVLAAWLLLLLAALLQLLRTPFAADLSAFLPDRPEPRQQVLIEQLKSGLPSRLLLVGLEGGTAAERADASRRLAQALRAGGRFEQVSNGDTDGWRELGSWLFERRYTLSPAVTPARFTPEGLRDAIDESLSLLGTPAGQAIKPLLERDPTGETQRLAEAMIPPDAPRSEDGVWTSRDGRRAVLLATTRAEGADLDAQAATLAAVRSAFAALQAPALRLQLSGTPVFSVDSRSRIEYEVHLLAAVGLVLVVGLLGLAFASPRAILIAMLPVGTGVLAGIAVVGAVFGNVHGFTLGFGITLIGEAVDYAIYYLIQARRAPGEPAGRGWRAWLPPSSARSPTCRRRRRWRSATSWRGCTSATSPRRATRPCSARSAWCC
ncbi:MMPL family transporter [Piscinibacter sakaiensis]|uniref:MMPL family transporter n=1 Tax=Piscinibacter sakaiensis TaxID=1547922 RepID=UPI00372C4CDE